MLSPIICFAGLLLLARRVRLVFFPVFIGKGKVGRIVKALFATGGKRPPTNARKGDGDQYG